MLLIFNLTAWCKWMRCPLASAVVMCIVWDTDNGWRLDAKGHFIHLHHAVTLDFNGKSIILRINLLSSILAFIHIHHMGLHKPITQASIIIHHHSNTKQSIRFHLTVWGFLCLMIHSSTILAVVMIYHPILTLKQGLINPNSNIKEYT